jgi:UDP-N-acetylmuramoyl-L-alanyl-D-glutamate--2,6-diaminopimelate ligase
MTVAALLRGWTRAEIPPALAQLEISQLAYDSRLVQPGALFFAFPGARADGRQFAAQAAQQGARAIASELPPPGGFAGPWIELTHGRKALATAAKRFYQAPDEQLGVTSITGTNGKTTTALLLDHILRHAGFRTALVGTIAYHVLGVPRTAVNTTPESLDLFRLFRELLDGGGSHVTMESSSHAHALGRVHGIQSHTAVFTNLTQDHLDFHGTMENYFAAKHLLFRPEEGPGPRFAVLNTDDPWGRRIRPAAASTVLTYGLQEGAQFRARQVESGFAGLRFTVQAPHGDTAVQSPLVGHINVYNVLAAFTAAHSLGLAPAQIASGIASCQAVPGRFERVDAGQPFLVVVDYAHTDDALRNVIRVARGLTSGRILTLFGCGGDRDKRKRPLMAAAAAEGSQFVIVTSDNPRSEDPQAIINDALPGLAAFHTPYAVEPDRATAIALALREARPGDVVLLAGKGHETYQVLRDRTIDFDDRVVARAALRDLGYAP